MPLVGSRPLARKVWAMSEDWEKNGSNPFTDLDTWKVLKAWGCRRVILHVPTNVVYKVDGGQASYHREALDNKTEVRNARTLRRRSDDGVISAYVRIPRVSGFTFTETLRNGRNRTHVVVAMEYIDGVIGNDAAHSIPTAAKRELLALGFNDMHPYNFIWAHGYIYPVDMGSARSQRVTSREYEVDNRCMW